MLRLFSLTARFIPKITTLTVALLIGASLSAQQPRPLTTLTFPELDENTFTYAAPDGFLWVGAFNGLYRFDGTTLERIVINDPESEVRHGQNVQSPLFPDAEGNIWFTTYEALHVWRRATGSIGTFALSLDSTEIREDYRAIDLDASSGTLILKLGDRLVSFDLFTRKISPFGDGTLGNYFALGKNDKGDPVILALPWHYGEGLEAFTQTDEGADWAKTTIVEPGKFINAVFVRPGLFYVGGQYGLYRLEFNEGIPELTKVLNERLPNSYLQYLAYDQATKNLILNYPKKRVFFFNLSTQSVTGQIAHAAQPYKTIWQDPQGNEWISTGNGFRIFAQAFAEDKSAFSLLPADKCTQYPDGRIALSNKELGIARLAPKETVNHNLKWSSSPVSGRLFPGCRDTLFTILFNNLNVTTNALAKESSYPFARGLGQGLTSFAQGKTLAVTQDRVGWLRFSADSTFVIPVRTNIFPEKRAYTKLRRLDERRVAVVSNTNTVFIASYHKERLHFTDSIFIGAEVQDIVAPKGTSGTYLIGTTTGLWKYHNGTLRSITTGALGYLPTEVYAMQYDSSGTLWFGTTNGLFSYANETVVRYDTLDGLPADLTFLSAQVPRHSDGKLLFTTSKGVMAVDPAQLAPAQHTVRPYIADLWINGATSNRYQELSSGQVFTLGKQEKDLRFRVKAAAGTLPWESFSFTAVLDDRTVRQQLKNGEELHFASLDWGTHTLVITAFNHHGLPVGRSDYELYIEPPLIHQTWFQVLASVTMVAILYFAHYLSLRKAVAKQVRLREIQETVSRERDRIAEEVHDDLGGQLSSIMFISQSLLMRNENNQPDTGQLNRINELSHSSLQNVRDIIFTLDTRRGTLGDLYRQLENIGKEIFSDHELTFNATSDLLTKEHQLNSREKRNLILLVKEAFHNIVKHASATAVRLSITQSQSHPDQYNIVIEDDGVGFNLQEKRQSTQMSFGLENMEKKCQEMDAEFLIEFPPSGGTRIKVAGSLKSMAE